MNDETVFWIDTAKQVLVNPFVKIPCPKCGETFLQIHIIPWQNEELKVDVHLLCSGCDARNVVTKEAELVERVGE